MWPFMAGPNWPVSEQWFMHSMFLTLQTGCLVN